MSEEDQGLPPFAKLAVEAGLATLYLSALVFIAGWSYADRYFAELGLNLSAIEGLETSSFYAFSLWVFRDGWLTTCAVCGVVLVIGFLARKSFGGNFARFIAPSVALLAIASLFGASSLGAMRAAEQAPRLLSEDFGEFRRIIVHPKQDSALATFLAARPGLGAKGCLRKIYMDRRHLYAYAGYESTKGAVQPILIVPLAEIAVIETLTTGALCRP